MGDQISRNEQGFREYLHEFYYGDASSANDQGIPGKRIGLKPLLDAKVTEIDPRLAGRFLLGAPEDGAFREDVFVRVGRFGPFIEQGERRASIPDMMPPDEINLVKAMELLENAAVGDEPLGHCPDSGKPIYVKTGRFGPYVQIGHSDDEEKPKNASLMKGMEPADVTLEVALKLLSLPRTLGEHVELKEPIVASNGRFGPYIKCGTETRSLPAGVSPIDVTFEDAVALLAQPKTGGRGRGPAAKKEPMKVFEASPVTKNPVQLLEGRYGPYVSDGETNASLPRDAKPDELTFEAALDLLAVRAAMGGSKKKKAPRKAAATKAPKKAATKKAAATKTGTKKASTKKKAAKKPAE